MNESERARRIVAKFGGSSVADAASIKRVAARIVAAKQAGNEVVVVISAMGDTTDELMDLALHVSPQPQPRELDMLLTTGERQSAALLAMAVSSGRATPGIIAVLSLCHGSVGAFASAVRTEKRFGRSLKSTVFC